MTPPVPVRRAASQVSPQTRPKSESRGIALIILGSFTLISVLTLFAVAGMVMLSMIDPWSDPHALVTDAAAHFADALDDAGVFQRPLDLDDPLLRYRKLHLVSDVGSQSARRVIEELRYLDAIDPNLPIDLYITSWGGWSSQAFAIIDTMHTMTAPVNTYALGLASSAGAMVLVAGTGTRYATPRAIVMIHANDEESENSMSFEFADAQRHEALWREFANLPDEWFPMNRGEEYYLSPELALKYGVVDAITE